MTSQQTSNMKFEGGELVFNEPMKIELQPSENEKTNRWIVSSFKPASTEPSSSLNESCYGNTHLSEEARSTEQSEEYTSNLKREKSQEICSNILDEEVTPDLNVAEEQKSEVSTGGRCLHVKRDQCCGTLDLEGWDNKFCKDCNCTREIEENVPIKNIAEKRTCDFQNEDKHPCKEETQCFRGTVEEKFPCRSVSEYLLHSNDTKTSSFKKGLWGDVDEDKQNGEKSTSGNVVWKFITPNNSSNNIGCERYAPNCNGSHVGCKNNALGRHIGCKCRAPSGHVGCICDVSSQCCSHVGYKSNATNCCGSHVGYKCTATNCCGSHVGYKCDAQRRHLGCKCNATYCCGRHFGYKCDAQSSHLGCNCAATNCCGIHVERKRKAPSFFESHLGCKRCAACRKDSCESVEMSRPFTLTFKRRSLVANFVLRPKMSPNRTQEETLERRRDASVQTMTNDDVVEK